MVTELLVLGFIFFVLVASVSFYFYSRIMYMERKIQLLETILMDIKMTMEMEDTRQRDDFVEYGHKQQGPVIIKDVSGTPVEGEELATQAEFYNMVLEGAPATALSESKVEDDSGAAPVSAPEEASVPDYDAMTREELVTIAEKRSLRLTKRISKQAVLALLREADKNSSGKQETDKDGAAITGNMEGSADGAPLDMVESESVPL